MKKIVKISGIVACAAVLFFNVSLSGNKISNSINLSSMTKITKANAECAGFNIHDNQAILGSCLMEECLPYQGGWAAPCDQRGWETK